MVAKVSKDHDPPPFLISIILKELKQKYALFAFRQIFDKNRLYGYYSVATNITNIFSTIAIDNTTMNIEIKQTGNEKKGSFYADVDGKHAGVLTYVYSDADTFIIEHTEVNEAYEGKGLGRKLVDAAVSFAREKGFTIIPLCPYASSVFKKTPEYSDVLAANVQI
jgi:predicted GNAT family acetyltransferase